MSRLTPRRAFRAVASAVALAFIGSGHATAVGLTPLGPPGGSYEIVAVHPELALAVAGNSESLRVTPAPPSWIWASRDNGLTWHRASARERAALPGSADRQRDPFHPPTIYRIGELGSRVTLRVSTDNGRTFRVRSRDVIGNNASFWLPTLLVTGLRGHTVLLAGSRSIDGVASGRLRRSTDGGYTWRDVPGTTGELSGMWRDPARIGTVYAAITTGSPDATTYLLQSSDAGASWRRTGRGIPGGPSGINGMYLDRSPRRAGRILFGGTLGLWRSDDSGATWRRALGRPVAGVITHPRDPSIILAGTRRGVIRSIDGGRTWASSSVGLAGSTVASIAPTGGGRLYSMVDGRLVVSTDEGTSWQRRAMPMRFGDKVLVDPTDADRLVIDGDDSVQSSTDGGVTWTRPPTQLTELIDTQATGSRLYARDAHGETLWTSQDFGAHWVARPRKLLWWFEMTASGDHLYAWRSFSGRRVLHSRDAGATWQTGAPFGAGIESIAASPSKPSVLYATATSRRPGQRVLGVSADGGATWHVTHRWSRLDGPELGAITVAVDDPHRLYATSIRGGLTTSGDSGRTWTSLAQFEGFGTQIVPHPTDPSTLYLGTWADGIWRIAL